MFNYTPSLLRNYKRKHFKSNLINLTLVKYKVAFNFTISLSADSYNGNKINNVKTV
jgi:hypothetical protein